MRKIKNLYAGKGVYRLSNRYIEYLDKVELSKRERGSSFVWHLKKVN